MGENVELIGISNGYAGLINGDWRVMEPHEFSGILTVGGTILGTKRTPFKLMRVVEEDQVDKVAAMKKNYQEMKLDCLLCLGGNGTHKTANLLAEEGLNIIALPKTIDNDIFGTDVTFGFHSAMEIATEAIDRVHTTAGSHSRCMVVELMGNKAGWLTLYAGIAAERTSSSSRSSPIPLRMYALPLSAGRPRGSTSPSWRWPRERWTPRRPG